MELLVSSYDMISQLWEIVRNRTIFNRIVGMERVPISKGSNE